MVATYDSQSLILLAFQKRLIDRVPNSHSNNTWIDDAPIPFGKDAPPTEHCFSLTTDDGSFDPDWGGNACALAETTTVTVTHMQKLMLDDTKKLTNIVAENRNRSMLKYKHDILSAFLFDTVNETFRRPWRPQDATGSFLFDTLHPTVYVSPKRHKDWPLLYHYIEFKMTFFWKL